MAGLADGAAARRAARWAGAFYLVIMVGAIFAEAVVRGGLVVSGDAAATAAKISASQDLWRWGVLADVAVAIGDVAVGVLLFLLLAPVSKALSFGAAAFRLVYSAVILANAGLFLVPVLLVGNLDGKSAAEAAQAMGLAMYSLRLHTAIFAIGLMLFGLHLVMVGALVAKAKFLPRVLGWALGFAGVCYVVNSALGIVAPSVASGLFPWILLPGFLAEGTLTLWLLIAGVKAQAWDAQNQGR